MTSSVEGIDVLVIEDDPATSDVLKTFFEGKGSHVRVAADGGTGLKLIQERLPDVVLLDLMLPDMDGLNVLDVLDSGKVPVLAITAKDDVDDLVKGLAEGLDDYITKPFRLREVLARTESTLRRYRSTAVEPVNLGDFKIDDVRKEVTYKGEAIPLTKKEYTLFFHLAQEPGKVYSDQELIRKVWPEGALTTSSDVKRYIHLLRQKVEIDPSKPQFVQTVRGFGYKLEI